MEQNSLGRPEVLRPAERERPAPGPTEVLVQVHAAGVNPVDWKVRAAGGLGADAGFPLVLGWDVAGVVTELGAGVTRFTVGDPVYGMPWFPRPAGGYGEYLTAPSRHFAATPAGLTHVQAAGLPLAGLTAWQALVDTADLQPGQRVLVSAAAGGVGHLAVQIAKARGAYVLGTARAGKHDFLRSLGVDEPIDYTGDGLASIEPVDVALDLVGGDTGLVDVLRPGGTLIPVADGAGPGASTAARAAGVRVLDMLVEPDHHGLEQLTDLVESGQLRVEIAATFPLADAAKAHEVGEAGRTRGKLVLTVVS